MTRRLATWTTALSLQAAILLPQVAQAATIHVLPTDQVVTLGSTATVTVAIDGLDDGSAPSLGAFDVTVNFDGTLIEFVDAVYGDPVLGDQLDLFGLGSLFVTTPSIGSVNLFQLSFDSADDLNALQAGSFTLAVLTFDTNGAGTSALELGPITLSDADAGGHAATSAGGSRSIVDSGSPVPEPATILLTGTGITALAWLRRKRRTGGVTGTRPNEGIPSVDASSA